jgi:hypothetical protein
MSEMAPLGAGFDLSIRGFGQASGGVRARRGVTAACQTQRRDSDFDSGDSGCTWLECVMTFLRIVITL